jgi:hypothetical protein
MRSSIKRRDFLVTLSGFTAFNAIAGPLLTTNDQPMNKVQFDLRLRPHHIIDIITDHGKDVQYEPHPYGHSQHIVAPRLLSDLDLKIMLVLEADDICKGCMHLLPDGKCKDVLAQLTPSPSKQAYNDVLDSRLFDLLEIDPDSIMTTRAYLAKVNELIPGIERICTHPKEVQEERLDGLVAGLVKLGIRLAV